jgi:hypothetical protein
MFNIVFLTDSMNKYLTGLKRLVKPKHSSLFYRFVSDKAKKVFLTLAQGANAI